MMGLVKLSELLDCDASNRLHVMKGGRGTARRGREASRPELSPLRLPVLVDKNNGDENDRALFPLQRIPLVFLQTQYPRFPSRPLPRP